MDDLFFQYFRDGSPLEPYVQLAGEYGYIIYEWRAQLLMYLHLLASAIFPIWIGSHAALRCPPSARVPKKANKGEDDDDLEEEAEQLVEGLTPTDAILFPVMAGVTLGGLYFIIKWLEDPSILNKILNWYFSSVGVIGVGKLAADTLNVGTTIIFPSVWSSKDETYHVDPLISAQVSGTVNKARVQSYRKPTTKTNPLPGLLSNINFGRRISKALWSLRALLKSHWIFRLYVHGITSLKTNVKVNDVTGYLFGLLSIILYNTIGREWWLSNLIAFGFCYGTLQLMSPTTFWTGSLVLAGLFFYDIGMVFYTPMMVTVAKTLDAPIKLVIPGPGRGSMLGLGDVVLPGIMIALALRFDLYLHYLYKRKSPLPPSPAPPIVVKEPYVEATGVWGERFWTSGKEGTIAEGARFKKTYFWTSIIGYILSMIVTFVVMIKFNHAQPALLYLVPGVLGSLWGTAVVRGERKLMWEYTEDGLWGFDVDVEPAKVAKGVLSGVDGKTDRLEKKLEKKAKEHAHHVFLVSLSAPKEKKALLFEKEK